MTYEALLEGAVSDSSNEEEAGLYVLMSICNPMGYDRTTP